MTVHTAMIVAGGAGTRLRPLTATTPKPMLPLCGAPFLSGMIGRLAAQGIERVRLVVGADTAPFALLRDDAARRGVEVEMVPEPEPLDTAGGVRLASEDLTEPFLVCNGDILTDVDVVAAVRAHREADAAATIVCTRVEDTSSYGVAVREGSRIVRFVEKPAPGELPGHDTVNAGTYVLEPAALQAFPTGPLSFEREVFPALLEQGERVEGFVGDGRVWADLGTPTRLLAGQRLVLDHALDWPPMAATPEIGFRDHRAPSAKVAEDAWIEPPVQLGPGAAVEAGARLGPNVVLGAEATVGAGAVVSDSALFDRARVGADTIASGLLLGFDGAVGDRVHVEGDTAVGDGEQVPDDARLVEGTRWP